MNQAKPGSRRGSAGLSLLVAALLCSSCATTVTRSQPDDEDLRCIVGVEPAMRMVTFAPPAGLDRGVTSLFFRTMPDVEPGDLVQVRPGGNGEDTRLERREAQAGACRAVLDTATSHHGPGHSGGHNHH